MRFPDVLAAPVWSGVLACGVATADLASSAIPLRTAPAQQLQLLPSPALADKGWGQLESARQLRDF
jgi:hypothetical protein